MKKQHQKNKFRWADIVKATVTVTLIFAAVVGVGCSIKTEAAPITAKVTLYEDIPLDIDLIDHIQGLCCDYNIPIEIALAVIEQESTYKADAVSYIGAKGLMQVQERWHGARMEKLGCTDLFDPYENTRVGMDYLGELLTYYDGNFEMMLTAYNLGQTGAYKQFFSKGIYQSDYCREVLEKAENIREGMTEMFITDDPHKDFDRHDAEQQAALEKCPKCSMCDEYIQDDYLYEINDEVICEECLNDNFRKPVEDYV